MKRIAIIGAGRIGRAAHKMLADEGVESTMFDVGVLEYMDSPVRQMNSGIYDEFDFFLAACPYEVTAMVAGSVKAREGKVYFDLTEDVAVGKVARQDSKSVMIPHCGLAPGAVSIIGRSLLPSSYLHIRVGALPQESTNRLGHALNWSTDGLVNEYLKKCRAIVGGKEVLLDPLQDLVWLGPEFEAFNTSGGIGTLVETTEGIFDLTYKTIRRRGHCDLMLFLLDDLGFRKRPHALVKLLDESLPHNVPDMVKIDIIAESAYYSKTIYPADGLSAIQRATAAGVVAVMLSVLELGYPPPRPGNWCANEDFMVEDVQRFKCWRDVYGVL